MDVSSCVQQISPVSLTSQRDLDADIYQDEERHKVHSAQPEDLFILVGVVRAVIGVVLARSLSDLL